MRGTIHLRFSSYLHHKKIPKKYRECQNISPVNERDLFFVINYEWKQSSHYWRGEHCKDDPRDHYADDRRWTARVHQGKQTLCYFLIIYGEWCNKLLFIQQWKWNLTVFNTSKPWPTPLTPVPPPLAALLVWMQRRVFGSWGRRLLRLQELPRVRDRRAHLQHHRLHLHRAPPALRTCRTRSSRRTPAIPTAAETRSCSSMR